MANERPIGIGLVGTGWCGWEFWRSQQQSSDVKMVACYNRNRKRAEKFAQAWGGEVMDSLEALTTHAEVEAVTIFTSNNAHREPVELAAAAGKHVFVEKPIANRREEAVAMLRACDAAGVQLMVGHSTRYHATNRAIKQLLDSGQIGEVVLAEGNLSHSGGTTLLPNDWRWYWEEAPGGPLMQLSVHVIDTLHYFFGPTKRVTAFAKSDLTASEIEDVFLTLLEFESGLLAYVGTNYVSPWMEFLHIYGRSGILRLADKRLNVSLQQEGGMESREVPTPESNAFTEEMKEFVRAIRTGTPPETDGRAGLLALDVVWAAIQSAQWNRPVEVGEISQRPGEGKVAK